MGVFPNVRFQNFEKIIFSYFTGVQILILVIFTIFSGNLLKILNFYLNKGLSIYMAPMDKKIGISDLYGGVSKR